MAQVMISVVMPTYNTPRKFLEAAIQSILMQTYPFFEFIIIDDCSTDGTNEYLRSLNDERVRIITNQKNLGITKSLNIGFQEAKGEYIARMDSDDIAYPERLKKQLTFMEANPDVIVCGTWIQAFGGANYTTKRVIPSREYHKASFLFGNIYGLCHPTAFFRKSLLRRHNISYDETLTTAQDYGMWSQCVNVGRIANVDEILLQYRVHNSQISIDKRELQESCVRKVQRHLLELLLYDVNKETADKHFLLCKDKSISRNTVKWFKYLGRENRSRKIYDIKTFNLVLKDILKSKVIYSAANARGLLAFLRVIMITPFGMKGIVFKVILKRIMRKWKYGNESK